MNPTIIRIRSGGQSGIELCVSGPRASECPNGYQVTMENMGFNNLDDSREGIAKYLRRNPATCFVAECGDSIVGVILSGHDGRRGFIHHLAVAENCRRQGIATELLECAVSSLAAEGINKVALLVFNRNEAGNAFWEKNGFTSREDLVYRNKALVEMVRIDT